jgi:hypothetical protein
MITSTKSPTRQLRGVRLRRGEATILLLADNFGEARLRSCRLQPIVSGFVRAALKPRCSPDRSDHAPKHGTHPEDATVCGPSLELGGLLARVIGRQRPLGRRVWDRSRLPRPKGFGRPAGEAPRKTEGLVPENCCVYINDVTQSLTYHHNHATAAPRASFVVGKLATYVQDFAYHLCNMYRWRA